MKKKLSIIFFIVGIISVLLSILFNNLNKKNINLQVEDFQAQKKNNQVFIDFNLKNPEDKDYPKGKLVLNFYDNTNLLYQYEYEYDQFLAYQVIGVSSILDFEYTNITRYEFIIGNSKLDINPTYQ